MYDKIYFYWYICLIFCLVHTNFHSMLLYLRGQEIDRQKRIKQTLDKVLDKTLDKIYQASVENWVLCLVFCLMFSLVFCQSIF